MFGAGAVSVYLLYNVRRGRLYFKPHHEARLRGTGSATEAVFVMSWTVLFIVYWFATWAAAKGDDAGDNFLAAFSILLALYGLTTVCATTTFTESDTGAAGGDEDHAMPVDDIPDSAWQRLRRNYTFSPHTLSFKRKPRRTVMRGDGAAPVVGIKLQSMMGDGKAEDGEERLRQFELAEELWANIALNDSTPAQPISPTRSYSEPVYMLENNNSDSLARPSSNRLPEDLELGNAVYEEDDYLSVITLSDLDTSEIEV
jgi:hypothetical protein